MLPALLPSAARAARFTFPQLLPLSSSSRRWRSPVSHPVPHPVPHPSLPQRTLSLTAHTHLHCPAPGGGPGLGGPGPGGPPRQDVRMSSTKSDAMSQRMVWVDLEMTGLDIEKDEIIEMACIITDSELNVLAEGPNLIINQPDELLDGMSDWCVEHHGQSGLTQAVKDSKISLQQAEYEFLSFIRQHTQPGQCPLAGNSVHADKKFLDKYMPQFMHHLHYRIIDVSTIKELCRRWFPEDYKLAPQKKASHRALEDIQESIRELRFYRANVFRSPAEPKVTQNGDGNKTAAAHRPT